MKRGLGVMLLALLAALAWDKAQAGLLPEMLWMCHVAACMLAVGLVFDWAALSAVGFLYQLAVGVPAYLLHLASGGDTTWVSFVLHLSSPVCGWLALRGRVLPRPTAVLAMASFGVVAVSCLLFTPEALNINLAFRPWAPLSTLGVWPSRVGNAGLMLAQLVAVQWLFNRRKKPMA
jgi:hypothetical protein